MYKIVNSQMYVNEDKKVVTTKITDQMGRTFMGQAWCSENDTFDIDFGSKLSYLRAKRRLLNSYNNENRKWYDKQMKMFAEWKEAQEEEIEKFDYIIGKVNDAIDDMLDNQD